MTAQAHISRWVEIISTRLGLVDTERLVKNGHAEHAAIEEYTYFESLKVESLFDSHDTVTAFLVHLYLNTSTAEPIAQSRIFGTV